MNVTLPDGTALELPEGSSALDAARAIGPKLAEQAVLARVDGEPRDLRLPLPDGAKLQILTTRDHADPDALHVLRHSASHLLAEAVRRLHPGVKVAIGPPIENGFYYDFEFPQPIREEDLAAIEEEVRRELSEGRTWERVETGRDEARSRFEAEGEPYKLELVDTAEGDISLYTQGDFTDLCRGPHLQDSKPIKAFKVTGLAGAYWRGDEKNTQLTRIYGTAFFNQADLDAYLERLEAARANDHRRLGRELDLFHFDEHSPGSPFWHPKGMALVNVLEDLRRCENTRRGYDEVRTPIIYDKSLWETSGHWEKFRGEHVPHAGEGEEHTYGLKPMNCPGHMLLFGSRCAATAICPLRYAEASTLHRNEPTGTLHGLLRVRHVTQDDAHIFCASEQIERRDLRLPRLRARTSTTCSAWSARSSSRRGPTTSSGPTRSGTSPRRRSVAALERRGIEYYVGEGEGAFYGPKIDLHMKDVAGPLVADGDDPARRADAEAVRPHLHGRRQPRAHAVRRPSRASRLARAVHGDPDRALRRRVPGLAGAGAGARRPGRRGASRRRRASSSTRSGARGVRAEMDERDETLGKRIRDAELQKVPYVVVWGDRESREAMAVRKRGGQGVSAMSLDALVEEIAALRPF